MTAPAMTRPPTSRPPAGRNPNPPPSGSGLAAGRGYLLTEAALVMLTVAAALDLSRLFLHRSTFLGPVLLTALAVHGVCWLCRRHGLGLAVAALGSVVVFALLASWTLFPHHLAYGVPSRATAHEARLALSAAMRQYRTAVVPTPIAAGFTLASAAGCAVVAFLGDWAAFRMRATVEACLPSFSVFVFSAALAQGHGAVFAAGFWLAAALAFLLVREAGLERPGPAWFASRAGRGPVALLQAGALIGVLALVVGLAIGPYLPGASTHALVNWRHHGGGGGGGGRTTGSPLVDIRSRLTDLSQTEAFTVTSDRPAYWRLTSLDSFDGSGWSLNDTYRHAGSTLTSPSASQSRSLTATFNVSTLTSIWLPSAFRPVRYSGPGKVSYSADAGSLIADKATSDGLSYTVQSSVPAPDVTTLEASPAVSELTDPSVARDLQLPAMPPLVGAIANEVTRGAQTPYEKARRLQDYFRSPEFTYDLNVPSYDGTNAIVAFLQQKRGFCQQFAATYAAMARLLGLPTRVAVGFTQGNIGSDGKLHVLDLNAHAWPEVYFSGIGWLAFEPTPGRGAPGAQGYTGVTPQQASDTGSTTPTTLSPTATTIAGANSSPTSTPRRAIPRDASAGGARHHSHAGLIAAALILGALIVLLAIPPILLWARRARRRAGATTPDQRALVAWAEVAEELSLVGAPPGRGDTPHEYARRATSRVALPVDATAAVNWLADYVVRVSYGPRSGGSDEESAMAEEASRVVTTAVTRMRTRWQRVVDVNRRALSRNGWR